MSIVNYAFRTVVGRDYELHRLECFLENPDEVLAVVSGPRRTGITALVAESLRYRNEGIHYCWSRVDNCINVGNLLQKACAVLNVPHPPLEDLRSALTWLLQQQTKNGFVIWLDNYHTLRDKIPEADSIIFDVLENTKISEGTKLILSGSDIEPVRLFTDTRLRIEPLPPEDTARINPVFSPEDQKLLYAYFGGLPSYHDCVRQNESVRWNILRMSGSSDAQFDCESEYLLSRTVRETERPMKVLDAVGAGASAFDEIQRGSGIENSFALGQLLQKLVKFGFLKPLNAARTCADPYIVRYEFADNYTAFYFSTVRRYPKEFRLMYPGEFYDKYMLPWLEKKAQGEPFVYFDHAKVQSDDLDIDLPYTLDDDD